MRRSRPGPPTWWAALAGLALPVACPGCGAPDLPWCAGCRAECETPRVAPVSLSSGPPDVPVLAAAAYAGPLRRVVVAWKDEGRHDLTPVLAGLLGACLRTRLAEIDATLAAVGGSGPGSARGGRAVPALVPAPSSRAAVRRRGEDVVAGLARAAAAGVGGMEVATVLRQRRGIADQAGLGRHEREANLAGRLVLRGRPPAAAIVVDDVLTTGATAAAAVAALRAGGVAVVGVCAVSATPARRPLSVRPRLG